MAASVFFASASELTTLTNTFTVGGVATDPTTVSLIVTDPTGASTTYTYAATEITKTSTGVYTKDVTSNLAGTWAYEWIGTGTATDTTAGTWEVLDTDLGKLYATVETLKSRLRLTGTQDDFELHVACFAASRAIEDRCDRHFWRTATGTARTYRASDWLCASIDDLVSLSALATDDAQDGTYATTWSASDYQLLASLRSFNPSRWTEVRPYRWIRAVGSRTFPRWCGLGREDLVKVTGVFGWPKVPWPVKLACLTLAHGAFVAKDAAVGGEQYGEMLVPVGTTVRVNDMLRPYRIDPVKVG